MSFSSYLQNKVLDHAFGIAVYTPATQFFLALYVGDPESGGVETTGSAYTRGIVAFATGSNLVTNSNEVDFTLTEDWGTITHCAVYDALTGGNILASAQLTTPVVTAEIAQIVLNSGSLDIRMN